MLGNALPYAKLKVSDSFQTALNAFSNVKYQVSDSLRRVFLSESEGFRFVSEPSGCEFLCESMVSDSFQIRLKSI